MICCGVVGKVIPLESFDKADCHLYDTNHAPGAAAPPMGGTGHSLRWREGRGRVISRRRPTVHCTSDFGGKADVS